MSQYVFILAIIAIVSISSIVKMVVRHRLGIPQSSGREGRGGRRGPGLIEPQDAGQTARLLDEVKLLKDRIQTLERIAVDKENSLSREIENLRDR
ncbi:MAG: hypothetical protein LH610_03100 [Sphingomonas bacterium]|nr:hypothetical protein [Sphingomonas bacterium]